MKKNQITSYITEYGKKSVTYLVCQTDKQSNEFKNNATKHPKCNAIPTPRGSRLKKPCTLCSFIFTNKFYLGLEMSIARFMSL